MIKNILLFLTAVVLFIILGPIGFIYGIVTRFQLGLSKFFLSLAKAIDQLGNAFAQYLLDDIMIKDIGYKFGDIDDTVSYVLGINERDGTLTKLGLTLCFILNLIDEDHCKNSI